MATETWRQEQPSDRALPTATDPFDEWLHAPLADFDGQDPRFEVRRARPEEFPAIYRCVDAAFGRRRPREVYDWQYLHNPFGRARCWILVERATGEVLKTGAEYPWPLWRGDEPLLGGLSGDAATLPHWQRKGLSRVRRPVQRAHPWYGRRVVIAGPNEGSRAVTRGNDRGEILLGFLPGGVRLLRSAAALERARLPSALARPLGACGDAALRAWMRAGLGRAHSGAAGTARRVEEVQRFDAEFDPVTLRCMRWPLYWSPHNADFLNWRYLDHPGERYVACAAVSDDERPVGYAVVRLADAGGTLTELVFDESDRATGVALLRHVLALARDAGCPYLAFVAPPAWRHWGLLRRAGFVPYRTRNFFEASCRDREPEVTRIESWRIGPGDRDYR